MFNRVSGLSLLVVSAGSIAYQLVKRHRENEEARRRARIAEGPSINELLDKLDEGFNSNVEESTTGQNI